MTTPKTLFMVALLGVAAFANASPRIPAGDGVLSIDVSSRGSWLDLLVVESSGGEVVVLHYRSGDGGETFSKPVRVDIGSPPPFSPHRGMDVQIAASGDNLVAAWMTAGTGLFGSGPIATVCSDDGGRTWTPGPNPADDGLTTGHSFLDIAAGPDGQFHLVWLDSRDGSQGLRYAGSRDGGRTWSENRTLQPDTCECCWNAIATGPGETVAVLYRHRFPRDMRTVFSVDSGNLWSDPITAGTFGWEFDGCPHVGGGVALTDAGDSHLVHSLVWTGAENDRGVHAVRGDESTRLGSPDAIHPALAGKPDGRLLAVWIEKGGGKSPVRFARSSDHGRTWGEPVAVGSALPTATHPLVVATAVGFTVFWTETPDGGQSRWSSFRIEMPPSE